MQTISVQTLGCYEAIVFAVANHLTEDQLCDVLATAKRSVAPDLKGHEWDNVVFELILLNASNKLMAFKTSNESAPSTLIAIG